VSEPKRASLPHDFHPEVSPAVAGFNLRFHSPARAQLIGEYTAPAS
jgi:hypothetical protein